jgi:hypothetical protein
MIPFTSGQIKSTNVIFILFMTHKIEVVPFAWEVSRQYVRVDRGANVAKYPPTQLNFNNSSYQH